MRTIQKKWIRDSSKAMLTAMPPASRWHIDERMVALKAQHKGQSVVYGVKANPGYKTTEEDVIKFGCTYDFHRRMGEYRFAISAVVVVPTPFPRAAEVVLHYLFQNCRLYALETVKASPERLKAALDHAVKCVDVAVDDMGHAAPVTTHRAYDGNLCKYMIELLNNAEPPTPIKAPEDTPLSPYDCVAEAQLEAKRHRVEEREAKRRRVEEAPGGKVSQANTVQRFVQERCVLERYRADVAGGAPYPTFTPFIALWETFKLWCRGNTDMVDNEKLFGRLLTPITGGSKSRRFNKKRVPSDTWGEWTEAHRTDPRKLAKGRVGIRFKTSAELCALTQNQEHPKKNSKIPI